MLNLIQGLAVGFVIGILAEGLIKPLQAKLFRQGWKLLGRQLDNRAQNVIGELDQFFVTHTKRYYNELDRILQGKSEDIIRQVEERYSLSVLVGKIKGMSND